MVNLHNWEGENTKIWCRKIHKESDVLCNAVLLVIGNTGNTKGISI